MVEVEVMSSFFFSSRRRHTRLQGDWSSDVCSSDLWKVSVGETARAVDYIAPPEGITKEFSDTADSHEINYSHARYMTPEEVEAAFGEIGRASCRERV